MKIDEGEIEGDEGWNKRGVNEGRLLNPNSLFVAHTAAKYMATKLLPQNIE